MNANDILRRAKTMGINISLAPEHQIRYESTSPPPPLEARVRSEGYVLCWADALEERVAFHQDDLDLTAIPTGFVPYSLSELALLFGPDQPDMSIRLIHQAKVLGMKVKANEPEMGNGTNNK